MIFIDINCEWYYLIDVFLLISVIYSDVFVCFVVVLFFLGLFFIGFWYDIACWLMFFVLIDVLLIVLVLPVFVWFCFCFLILWWWHHWSCWYLGWWSFYRDIFVLLFMVIDGLVVTFYWCLTFIIALVMVIFCLWFSFGSCLAIRHVCFSVSIMFLFYYVFGLFRLHRVMVFWLLYGIHIFFLDYSRCLSWCFLCI